MSDCGTAKRKRGTYSGGIADSKSSNKPAGSSSRRKLCCSVAMESGTPPAS